MVRVRHRYGTTHTVPPSSSVSRTARTAASRYYETPESVPTRTRGEHIGTFPAIGVMTGRGEQLGSVAQLVERLSYKEDVGGSSPS